MIEVLAALNPSLSTVHVRAKVGGKLYENYRLRTEGLACLVAYRDIFYRVVDGCNVKIVPENIHEMICPIVLAHLLMGDGNHVKSARKGIATRQVGHESILIALLTQNA